MSSCAAAGQTCIQPPPDSYPPVTCQLPGKCQSAASGRCNSSYPFCQCLAERKKIADEQALKCRQPGEYDPCQNPCARIPGLHPFCPPGQVIGILPKGYVEEKFPRSLNKPTSGPPPRLPWKQCVENTLVNDQVRRPLARWSHFRELPPVLVPTSEIQRIRHSIDERERKKEACEAAARAREAAREASYQRHSEWNYTVESLLARKRAEEEQKAKDEEREFHDLNRKMKEAREASCAAAQARAKQQLLFRKGLIRDFHAALAYSKSLKEMEDQRKQGGENSLAVCKFQKRAEGGPAGDSSETAHNENASPVENDPCFKRMVLENNRPEYSKQVKESVCKPELLELLKCDEDRVSERQAELEKEREKLKKLRTESPLPWPESYLKYVEEPKCENKGVSKYEKQEALRQQIFHEIHDKLANDAFVEYHEKEIERQACEYNEYKRRVDKLRKDKDRQLIQEQVARNIRNSEKAAEALMALKGGQQEKSDEYSRLKDLWETEYEQKDKEKNGWRQALAERVAEDFLSRKDNASTKRAELDATRQWEKECCAAVENYERECQKDNKRREAAKELQKYHLDQIANKVAKEEEERFLNAAYGEKSRMNYTCEMNEMKRYAWSQIEEWKAKGRPSYPMIHAMKKWDYDAGMNPKLYSRTPCGPQCRAVACEDNKNKEEGPQAESTAQRLGFGSSVSEERK